MQVTVDDLLWGADAIGKAIGRSSRQAFYLLERRMIPGTKVGKLWCASRRRLLATLAGEERKEEQAQ
jgi:hypothetical protein